MLWPIGCRGASEGRMLGVYCVLFMWLSYIQMIFCAVLNFTLS